MTSSEWSDGAGGEDGSLTVLRVGWSILQQPDLQEGGGLRNTGHLISLSKSETQTPPRASRSSLKSDKDTCCLILKER